jgi:ubiquinone/menaquinone biosynthesis C-methylase UbiE
MEKPDYGNWVSKRIVYLPSLVGFVVLGFAFLLWVLVIPAVLLFVVSGYFAYARYQFDSNGRNIQDKIRSLVIANLDWNGEGCALDIGCGNGALTVKLAQKYPKAQIVGIDFWGEKWEYSKSACEKNAAIEDVKERVTFRKASASALPFEDESFDAVVSNLVFHEVSDAADKRQVIREALRVIKKGGKFAFQDLFLIKQVYGNTENLVAAIQSWGTKNVEFVQTRDAEFIPSALKLPFMVGTIGLIKGEK